VPAEVVLLIAGAQLVGSPAGLVLGIALVAVADSLGGLGLYWFVGHGSRRLRRWLVRRFAAEHPASERQRRPLGPRSIFAIRCLPFVRVYAVIGSAFLGVKTKVFLTGALPASIVWVGAPMAMGFLLRDRVPALVKGFPPECALLAIAPAVVGLAILLARMKPCPADRPRGIASVPVSAAARKASEFRGRAPFAARRVPRSIRPRGCLGVEVRWTDLTAMPRLA
jgi:membrane protein DedA with SNARE-associated domain